MLLPIYVVVGVLNILANVNDFNIPNTPEFRNLRVKRGVGDFEPDALGNKVEDGRIVLKAIFNGDYFRERSKRSYQGYPQNSNTSQGYNGWNNYAASYPGNYGPYNGPGSNGYNPAGYNSNTYSPYKPQTYYNANGYPTGYSNSASGYNAYPAGYSTPPPGYYYPTPGYNPTTPGNNINVTSTTPRIEKSCIICNIGCPQFMKKIGIFCVDDDYD